jgi:hypothetical protein
MAAAGAFLLQRRSRIAFEVEFDFVTELLLSARSWTISRRVASQDAFRFFEPNKIKIDVPRAM